MSTDTEELPSGVFSFLDSALLQHLPSSWVWASLGSLGKWAGGGTPSKSRADYWSDGSVPWVTSKDMKVARIAQSQDMITEAGVRAARLKLMPPGSLLMVVRGMILAHTLPVAIATKPVTVNQDLRVLQPALPSMSEYIYWALRNAAAPILRETKESTHGTRRLESEILLKWPIPLPPLAEQKRIVEKVQALLTLVNAARERLAKVPAILKRFRQSVLAAACSGKLTEQWRKRSPSQAVPRAATLDSVQRKRHGRLWGAGVVPELTGDEHNSIPREWSWEKVAGLGEDDECVQIGPMSMRSAEFTENGVPVLNVGCVQAGWIDESRCDHLPAAKAAEFERYRVRENDVLFTRSGTVGRCAVAGPAQDGHVITFHLLRVRARQDVCLSRYLWIALQGAPTIRRQTEESQIGSTRGGFNTRLLASLDVPLPPVAEQREIIARVENFFGIADVIEQRLAAGTMATAALQQSVLSKAFRGELVPTEAELTRREGRTYETAEQLLERIRKERGASDGQKPAAKRRRSGAVAK